MADPVAMSPTNSRSASLSHRPDRGPPAGLDQVHRDLRLPAPLRRGFDEPPVLRVDQLRLVRAGDHPEGDAVADRVDGDLGRASCRAHLGPRVIHRARRVDDDDLGGAGGARSLRVAGGAHGHDGVDLLAAGRQELVLVGLGSEPGHAGLPAGGMSITRTVTLSRPPAASAWSTSAPAAWSALESAPVSGSRAAAAGT